MNCYIERRKEKRTQQMDRIFGILRRAKKQNAVVDRLIIAKYAKDAMERQRRFVTLSRDIQKSTERIEKIITKN